MVETQSLRIKGDMERREKVAYRCRERKGRHRTRESGRVRGGARKPEAKK